MFITQKNGLNDYDEKILATIEELKQKRNQKTESTGAKKSKPAKTSLSDPAAIRRSWRP